jgi:serine/threonine protein kinase
LHRLYETFDEGSDFYIVTELVEGGELFDRIVSKAHYTEKEARDLIKSLLETLNYMHTTGVVHRDLKPENLLLCSGALTLRHLTVSWLYVVSG